MSEPTEADLSPLPSIYHSARANGAVLVGQDKAQPVIEAVIHGDETRLQEMLKEPRWSEVMLQQPHTIYYEREPSEGGRIREVMARPISTLSRAVTAASEHDQTAALTVLLEFAAQHSITDTISSAAVKAALINDRADVFEAFVRADPKIVFFDGLGHGTLPLYEAARMRATKVVSVLLKHGADPKHPVQPGKLLGTYASSLLSRAAMCDDSRMLELLLGHGVPVVRSGALHTAAANGRFDNARFLLSKGADINERLSDNWTPMHYAAWRGQTAAMDFLVSHGAREDILDEEGRTAQQVFDHYRAKA